MTEIVSLPQPNRLRLVWILPLWFAGGAVVGSNVAGYGGQLFFLGALAGVWACAIVPDSESSLGLVPTLLGGVPVLLLLGWLLDRLRSSVWLWVGFACIGGVIAFYLLLQRHADLDAAVAHHGSLFAFGVCALQLGSYAATLLVLVLYAGRGRRQEWE